MGYVTALLDEHICIRGLVSEAALSEIENLGFS